MHILETTVKGWGFDSKHVPSGWEFAHLKKLSLASYSQCMIILILCNLQKLNFGWNYEEIWYEVESIRKHCF